MYLGNTSHTLHTLQGIRTISAMKETKLPRKTGNVLEIERCTHLFLNLEELAGMNSKILHCFSLAFRTGYISLARILEM